MKPHQSKIGRFLLEAEIGGGGMGKVYRALDEKSGQKVAVKVLGALAESDRARFRREAEALAQISHPGIVRYIDHGLNTNGEAYLAMEWLDGEDLRARLNRSGLSIQETVILAKRAAEALLALHELGLVHRDIKPANLFLVGGRAEGARLIDLGLVRAMEASGDLTKTGTALGTPAYMSPEQARGERTLDARTDLFSLGCVLFKCLTGRAPFEGSGMIALLTKIVLDEVPHVREKRPDISTALDDVVYRLTKKEPDERFQSARALLQALQKLRPEDVKQGDLPIAPSSGGLTENERRVLSMMLVSLRDGDAFNSLAHGGAQAPGQTITTVVTEHQGQMDRLLDGTMVVGFTDAAIASDQAIRAARCALAIRAACPEALIAVAMEWNDTLTGTPVGEAAERAQELLSQSKETLNQDPSASAIFLDDVSASLLKSRFHIHAHDGKQELVGERDEPSSATLVPGQKKLFGRQWEMSSLFRLFIDSIEEPTARAALVTAPPGIGKSRLLQEVVTELQRTYEDLTVWLGYGEALRAGSAFGLLGGALERAADIQQNLPLEERRSHLFAFALRAGTKDARRVAAFLGEIADAPFEPEAYAGLKAARADSALMMDQLRHAVIDLLGGLCAKGPVLLVLEDLHWGDWATIRILDSVLGELTDLPFLLLASARPEVHETFPRLWHARNVHELRLKPLSRRAAVELVKSSLGQDTVSDETVARIVAQADGNAFFLEELVRSVAEGGVAASEGLPPTLVAMAHARIDALDPAIRRLLRAASIFGDVFWAHGVEALLGGLAASDSFSRLVAARDLVVRHEVSRFAGEQELAFRHNLIREAAYATLTPADRALGHRLCAEWLSQKGESDRMVLAKHFDLGGDDEQAARHYLGAAAQSLYGADFEAAIETARLALQKSKTQESELAASVILIDAHVWRCDWDLALAHLRTVFRLGRPGSAEICRAICTKLTAGLLLVRPTELMEGIAAVLSLVPETSDDTPRAVEALAAATITVCVMGQRSTVKTLLEKVDSLAASHDKRDPLLLAQVSLAHLYSLVYGGTDVGSALRHAQTARDAFAELGDERNVLYVKCYEALIRTRAGDFALAERLLDQMPAGGSALLTSTTDNHRMHLYLSQGKLDEADEHIRAKILSIREQGGPASVMFEAAASWHLGEIALARGDLALAEREITQALDTGLRFLPLDVPVALAVLSEARRGLGRPKEALLSAREAMALVSRTGTTAFHEATVLVAHVEALRATGDLDGARAAIREAKDRLLDQQGRIEEPELRRFYVESIDEHARTLSLFDELCA